MVHEPLGEREPRLSARTTPPLPPTAPTAAPRERARASSAPQDRPPAPSGRHLMARPGPRAPAPHGHPPRRAATLRPPGEPFRPPRPAEPQRAPRRDRPAGRSARLGTARAKPPPFPARAAPDGLIAAPLPSAWGGGEVADMRPAPTRDVTRLMPPSGRLEDSPHSRSPRRNHFYYLVYFPPDVTAGLMHSRSQLLLSCLYPLGVPAGLMHSHYYTTSLPSPQLLLFCLFFLRWGCKTNALLILLFLLPLSSSCGCSAARLLLPQQQK